MPAILLIVALAAGSAFRFINLGKLEMSPDEGASWAAASAPTAAEVIARQPALNPGELPIHDLMLHGWIALFGSSMTAMRSLSAVFGVVSILLVYLVVCELFVQSRAHARRHQDSRRAQCAGLRREPRHDQVLARGADVSADAGGDPRASDDVPSRAPRRRCRRLRGSRSSDRACDRLELRRVADSRDRRPMARLYNRARRMAPRQRDRAARVGDRDCARGGRVDSGAETFFIAARSFGGKHRRMAQAPAFYEPFALFNKATGSFAFPILALLAIWGVIRGWQRGARDSIAFALLWMWAPPLMMVVASYAIAPVFVERYALSCFVPFFILVALGIFELPGDLRPRGSARARSRILARPYRFVRSQTARRAVSRSDRRRRFRTQAGRSHDRRPVVCDRSAPILSSG